ncbi:MULTISPECIES: Hsp20 family protein [Methylobacterium]|jgi:molecular chaperone IbpA|uniref:Molecular chaperone IbpA n=1 Tax=Methylobacterium brachiatum TaxID=269660 RepID=A0AAJ1TPY5_9HYPH|nr:MULTISPECIES: Hsp20 family protein [Methylobacterium]EIZ84487.1 heat shock protein Hsp20 [Methylobacterium sp. GXF4]MCB4801606.1 Hsp20 family protein [Methylobacterium brachiatum]MDH2311540.1 Hsp20 family protein [Methylobacterium brachiatum]MDQ0544861.1 molecular chaperone IbpA [Methylobacterium brachiatum]CAA2157044.1 Small heat shock protein IbpA [Methylobacterium brachiatum]
MRTYDVAPLFRSSIGFDRLFELLNQPERVETTAAWPPYNIEKVADDQYRITMAVAGFTPDEIELTQQDTVLLVSGQKKTPENERQYLHRGIAARTFRQTFNLADHVKVVGANLENGLLTVELKREVPEALKPRRIAIGGVTATSGQDNAPAQITESKVAQAKAAEPRVAEAKAA